MAKTTVTADGATVTTPAARTFRFGEQGGIQSVDTAPRTRHLSAEDITRLKGVSEPGHPNGHPLFEGLEIAVKNAGLHAAGQDMTAKPEAKTTAPAAARKPEGWKH